MSSVPSSTRTRILTAAIGLLATEHGVRMSDIARTAGLSRQAVYLHFRNRAELLVAATRLIDADEDIEARLASTRAERNGGARLALWVEVWGSYLAAIHGVALALLDMPEDEAAEEAWSDRMALLREGCEAAVAGLAGDGGLSPALTAIEAVDLLTTLLSIRTWEHLTQDCGWDEARYVEAMKSTALRALSA